MIDDNYIISNSICSECKYRVSRVISAEGLEVLDEYGNLVDDVVEISDEFCRRLCLNLDHIVLSCTEYINKNCDEVFKI